jgi:ABC-type antimicrobial peptide transport system permease subunit
VAIGLAVGSALALGRSVRSLVFGVQPSDIGPLVVASAVLTAVAGVASYLPARRAARMQPLSALRDE